MATLCKVETVRVGVHHAEIFHDSDWDEFRVKFYNDGTYQKRADYHTDDAEDAQNTARVQLGTYRPIQM